jgi:DNA-binding transcriptional MerR regulator
MVSKEQDRSNFPSLDISNVIAAFSEEQVQRMTGLTIGRLRYWAKTDFFKPSFVEDNPRLPYSKFYSFKDIVALRTLEILRVQNGVPLQQLRVVAERLSHLRDELWTKTTLFVENKKVIIVNPENNTPYEVVSRQYLLGIPLNKIINETRSDVIAFRSRPERAIGQLSRSRGIARNAWVIAGTRIPVKAIVRLREDGYTVDQIIAEYPDLRPEDVEAALKHGNSNVAA